MHVPKPFPTAFYQRSDVTAIAKELLGATLFTQVGDHLTGGKIVETEAYSEREKACHAHLGKKTGRTRIFFEPGGVAYVYLCYGIHHLFNVITHEADQGDAVLIRAIEPITGIDIMQKRRAMSHTDKRLTGGPGRLSQALGIDKRLYGASMQGPDVWIEPPQNISDPLTIVSGPRIGIDYAGEDKDLPWRYWLKGNRWVSR